MIEMDVMIWIFFGWDFIPFTQVIKSDDPTGIRGTNLIKVRSSGVDAFVKVRWIQD
jgi:hypothetical protein